MLQADRYGAESREMYCFVHGLPTKNPGSWLPSEKEPQCGNEACKELAEKWQLQGTSVPWDVRRSAECPDCKEERKRRCIIIADNATNTMVAMRAVQTVCGIMMVAMRAGQIVDEGSETKGSREVDL